jgi:hypothetical protein
VDLYLQGRVFARQLGFQVRLSRLGHGPRIRQMIKRSHGGVATP